MQGFMQGLALSELVFPCFEHLSSALFIYLVVALNADDGLRLH